MKVMLILAFCLKDSLILCVRMSVCGVNCGDTDMKDPVCLGSRHFSYWEINLFTLMQSCTRKVGRQLPATG